METNKPKEMFYENTKTAEKEFNNNTNSNLMDVFHRQFNAVTGFYTNFFNSMMGGNKSLNQNTQKAEINNKYKEVIDSRIEASKNVFKSATDAYHAQLGSAMETNKKMMDDIHTQISTTVKQTQNFWSDILKSNATPLKEEDLYVKEPNLNDIKNQKSNPVNEFMDHKSK
ncbi:MAG: hypothetical protein H0U95_16670 [Bacteroidetes bacterium]|nr:hypothetical protein [Bacteroidota bacterium]